MRWMSQRWPYLGSPTSEIARRTYVPDACIISTEYVFPTRLETTMAMTISMEDDLKRDFSQVCREIGLPPSTAIGIFARAVVRERGIPFPLSAVSSSERSARAYELAVADGIERGLADVAAGDVISREESRAARATRRTTA